MGNPWPGNNIDDHPGMIQVEVLVHWTRKARNCQGLCMFHRKNVLAINITEKAGAMNALMRVSAVLSNAPFALNLDCDQYINNSKVLREAMCFINMKCLDGIQGPMYVGTGCVFIRQALYGYGHLLRKVAAGLHAAALVLVTQSTSDVEESDQELEGFDGEEESSCRQSPVFIASAIGWLYGSVTEDKLTGFNMHCKGWKSVHCMPKKAAFKGSAPINLSDRFHQVLKWASGSTQIFFSCYYPLSDGYSGKLKCLQRLAYTSSIVYPFTSIPLLIYCTIPAVCLLTESSSFPTVGSCLLTKVLFTHRDLSLGSYSLKIAVIVHLYPFLKGLMGRQNRTPTIVVLWSILKAIIFSTIWVRIDVFLPKQRGPVLKQCGIKC
uniref:Cellulose synthase A catalytic subunit 5 [UDP-forming] n=1 Tax=Cajanus cajan TaxID=3821 RepID=A0A151U489_CAJCA|nr:Cellulose synthase A catalytic subunit 5 [UDP-forming] [Cajanus cajan]